MSANSTNLLGSEKSPYLLQHSQNPIAWRPWGEAAFAEAKAQGKPVFLSVGYSTCHWCHVMAHESFEDSEVAMVLNKDFISIKVDREERPDVDDIYMKALQALSGGGGWPMSVWLTPEGNPFFAGTYFPKYRFLQLLRRIGQLWNTEREQLLQDGERLLSAVRENEATESTESGTAHEWEEVLGSFLSHFQHHFDDKNGGFGRAPKFPQSMNLMLMMRQDSKTALAQAETMVTTTLSKMVRGGIYDQLKGGFHRYSVDEKWLVPHFEKMLYDQALITVSLVEAAQSYGPQPELLRAARETLDYVLREMTDKRGGFYSAQDADSFNPEKKHNEEGYFATYSYDELQAVLNEEEMLRMKSVFGVTHQGDFEGRSILYLQDEFDGSTKLEPAVRSALMKLEELRDSRPAPHLDDKIIAAWNGWMVWAFVKAGTALSETRYIEAAQKAMRFMRENLWSKGELARYWRDGEARARGSAEDYTSLIHACLELHQADFSKEWVDWALELQASLDKGFWDGEEGGYFAHDGKDPFLPLRPKDDYDGVTPSANSLGAYNLERLYLMTGEIRFKHQAERIFEQCFSKFKRYPSGLAMLGVAMEFHLSDPKVAVLNGKDWVAEFYHQQMARYTPNVLWTRTDSGWPVATGKTGPEPMIFVCEEGRCLNPSRAAEDAKAQLFN
jgi:uncharacterized protein